MFDHINKKDALIVGGVVVGLALLTVLMKGKSVPAGQSAPATAAQETVYVPTTSYNINYMDNQGTVSTTNNGGNTTTTYNSAAPVHIPTPAPIPVTTIPIIPPVVSNPSPATPPAHVSAPAPAQPGPVSHPNPTPAPPVTHVNPVTPINKPAPEKKVVYTAFGTTSLNSSLWGLSKMFLMNHRGEKNPTNTQIANEVNTVAKLNGIKNVNSIKKGQQIKMN